MLEIHTVLVFRLMCELYVKEQDLNLQKNKLNFTSL